jgi:hypothetical protein
MNYEELINVFYNERKQQLHHYYETKVEEHVKPQIPFELFVVSLCSEGFKDDSKSLYEFISMNYENLKERHQNEFNRGDLMNYLILCWKVTKEA